MLQAHVDLLSVFRKAHSEEELLSNILPKGSVGFSEPRALALSSRDLKKEQR